MSRILSSLFFIVLCSSCNFRIYTNGRFSHKEKGLTSKWRSKNDSCFVFGENEKLPDSVNFICESEFYSPFVWMTMKSPDVIMTNKARDEAKRLGANIMKVTDDGSTKFSRYRFIIKMYLLKEPYLTAYRNQVDSLNEVNKNFCIIHIKSYTYRWNLTTPIYLNDSLVGYCRAPTKRKGGPKIYGLDLKFDTTGILSTKINGPAKYKIGIKLEKGKVYDLSILPGKHSDYFIRNEDR